MGRSPRYEKFDPLPINYSLPKFRRVVETRVVLFLSQSSWPKIVVRKWLNLQSRGDEFYSDSFSLKGNDFCSVSGAFRVSVSDFKNVLGNFSADKTERRKSCSDKDCYVVVPDKFSGDFYCVVAL